MIDLSFIPKSILAAIRKKRPNMTDNEILATISSLSPAVIKGTLKITVNETYRIISSFVKQSPKLIHDSNIEFFHSQKMSNQNISDLLASMVSNKIVESDDKYRKILQKTEKSKKSLAKIKKDIEKKEIAYVIKAENDLRIKEKIKQLKKSIRVLEAEKVKVSSEIDKAKNMQSNAYSIGDRHVIVVE